MDSSTRIPFRILDSRGGRFGPASLLRSWLFDDRIRFTLVWEDGGRRQGEAILHASPASLGKVFRSALRRVEQAGPGAQVVAEERADFPAPSAPSRLLRRLRKGVPVWQTARLLSNPFDSGPVRTETVIPLPGTLRADPCAIHHAGRDWLLFEEQGPGDRGRLRAAELVGDGWVVRDGEILPRPHHLSWPCVLEVEGRILMLPETGEAGEVVLLEAEDFPFRWRKVRTLLDGRAWHDACVFRKDGLWWLFACPGGDCPQDHSGELRAFWSEDLLRAPFRPHDLNPLSLSVSGARPAGIPFLHEGKWIRPVQDCRGGYGTGVLLRQIDELTPQRWSETTVSHLLPPRGSVGIHTLNPLPGGGWIVDVLA